MGSAAIWSIWPESASLSNSGIARAVEPSSRGERSAARPSIERQRIDDDDGRPWATCHGRYPAIWVSGVICPLGPTFGHIHGPFCRAPPVKKIFCAGRRHLSSARRGRRKIWRAKRWGHFCMEKVECPRTSAVPPPAVLPHVTYRCPTQVHMWPPIERRTYVPSSHEYTFHSTAGISQTTSASGGSLRPASELRQSPDAREPKRVQPRLLNSGY